MKIIKQTLEETFANGFSNPNYKGQYEFYFHILAQCKIIENNDIDTLGVRFNKTHFELAINPTFFENLQFEQRLGVLAHEVHHIILNHLSRFPFENENINHKIANIATDCALNQYINRNHLPEGAIYPDYIEELLEQHNKNIKVKEKETAEYYYNLLMDNLPKETTNDNSNGSESNIGDSLDNHEGWSNDKISEELQKQMVKKMLNNAIEKSRGNLPENISEILDLWNKEAKVSWKKVLKNLTARKKANKKTTLLRRNRRFQDRPDIKGYTKDRKFQIVVIIDTSGSMSDEEIINGLVEIKDIVKKTSSEIKILQVDTNVHDVKDFDPKKKEFERYGNGGTYLKPALDYMKEIKHKPDCIITITDGYIESLDEWQGYYNCPYMFLLTSDISLSGIEYLRKARVFDIKEV